jgi:hypothetical protein
VDVRRAAIHLHIDELVLDGISAGERHRIADALRHELGGLLAQPAPWPAASRAVDVMKCGPARVTEPGGLGAGVAQSIYRGIVTPGRGPRA